MNKSANEEQNSRVIVKGFTGKEGALRHEMIEYGTNAVVVLLGKGGQ